MCKTKRFRVHDTSPCICTALISHILHIQPTEDGEAWQLLTSGSSDIIAIVL